MAMDHLQVVKNTGLREMKNPGLWGVDNAVALGNQSKTEFGVLAARNSNHFIETSHFPENMSPNPRICGNDFKNISGRRQDVIDNRLSVDVPADPVALAVDERA